MVCLRDLRLPRLSGALPPRWCWVGLFAWVAVMGVHAQPQGGRLEPAERARLRHELREQAWGHRHAERAAHHAARHSAWQDGAGTPARPMGPPLPVGQGTDLPPRPAPTGDGIPQHPALAADPAGERNPHRLTPDERRYLRWQLHEERERRRERGELPLR